MDFTPELSEFQGALLSADNVHAFSKIVSRGGNENAILDILERVFKFLSDKGYLTMNGVTEEGKEQMRIYCFYLILNCDIAILEDMAEMPGIENVVWTAPTITKTLLCEMVWGLSLENYLSDILVYCNPSLSVQVLMQLVEYLKHYTVSSCYDRLKLLCLSCYKLIIRLEFYDYDDVLIATILSDIYDNFLICTKYYLIPPNVASLNCLTEDELYKHKARNMSSLLSLTHECLGHYSEVQKFHCEGFNEMYLSTIKSEDIKGLTICEVSNSSNSELLNSVFKCLNALMDNLQILVMETSIEIFCAWSEFEENGKNMQKLIGEQCYLLHSRIVQLNIVNDHPIVSMLPQLSCKPIDIHDIINSADIVTIIDNANKPSDERHLWLESIINRNDLAYSVILLECIMKNIDQLNEDTCEALFRKVKALEPIENETEEVAQLLAVKAFTKIKSDRKHIYVSEHFSRKFFHNSMQCSDFHNMNTALFNKLITSPNENITDIYDVFIQNPSAVIFKIVSSSICDSAHSDLLSRIMTMLAPFADYYYDTETNSALVSAIHKVSETNLQNDSQLSCFVSFLSKLKENNVLPSAKLLLLVVMPVLHKALTTVNLNMIYLEIKILRESFTVMELVRYRAPLLVMIAQIIEKVRWTFATYNPEAPRTLEEALELQMSLFNTYSDEIPAKEEDWLKSRLVGLQPLNMYYYKKLWNPPGNNSLEIISGQKNLTNEKLALLLAKILCSCTSKEWTKLWYCIKGRSDESALHILDNALTLMNGAVQTKRDERTWACLMYCYGLYAGIIKYNILNEPLSNVKVLFAIEKLITLVNRHTEEDVQDLSTIVLTLFTYIVQRKADYTADISCLGNKIKHAKFAEIVNRLFTRNN